MINTRINSNIECFLMWRNSVVIFGDNITEQIKLVTYYQFNLNEVSKIIAEILELDDIRTQGWIMNDELLRGFHVADELEEPLRQWVEVYNKFKKLAVELFDDFANFNLREMHGSDVEKLTALGGYETLHSLLTAGERFIYEQQTFLSKLDKVFINKFGDDTLNTKLVMRIFQNSHSFLDSIQTNLVVIENAWRVSALNKLKFFISEMKLGGTKDAETNAILVKIEDDVVLLDDDELTKSVRNIMALYQYYSLEAHTIEKGLVQGNTDVVEEGLSYFESLMNKIENVQKEIVDLVLAHLY
ncbi:hypothetical protein K1728_05520 [Weissella confusa]|uniref:hypothetical protein n=1 Tax=Weissella confusa TaxID=1583 RepID=UPI001C6F8D0E|nr:hypothetical protein [Weissella confusa]QYU58858.1 hypothetical protein K1728_05520 [Weissella confusa]